MTTTLKSLLYSLLAGCLLTLALTFTACHAETFDAENPDVDLFVDQLRSGKYHPDGDDALGKVPKFTREDIGRLLKYADDLTLIPSFPLATASYSAAGRLRLGECILWTVETIRLGHNASMRTTTKASTSFPTKKCSTPPPDIVAGGRAASIRVPCGR